MAVQEKITGEIFYPESDGKPMSDNTLQYEWITRLKDGFETLYRDNPDVFVAGDLLWYPVEGRPDICAAPDVMVALGRPKGYRGSYQQWREANIAPQIAIEILSPGNSVIEMSRKEHFYERYGVEEYYIYDPLRLEFGVWTRTPETNRLNPAAVLGEWISPLTGVRFLYRPGSELEVLRPDGERFRSLFEAEDHAAEADERAAQARQQAEEERRRADAQQQRANEEHLRANRESERAARLAAQLREMGIEPAAE